jgi:hypothetical protein
MQVHVLDLPQQLQHAIVFVAEDLTWPQLGFFHIAVADSNSRSQHFRGSYLMLDDIRNRSSNLSIGMQPALKPLRKLIAYAFGTADKVYELFEGMRY